MATRELSRSYRILLYRLKLKVESFHLEYLIKWLDIMDGKALTQRRYKKWKSKNIRKRCMSATLDTHD